jgi:hypothetical protein
MRNEKGLMLRRLIYNFTYFNISKLLSQVRKIKDNVTNSLEYKLLAKLNIPRMLENSSYLITYLCTELSPS